MSPVAPLPEPQRTHNLAYADRLKPLCTQRKRTPPPTTTSLLRQRFSTEAPRSPCQRSARVIVRKYRRQVRREEFRRLRSIVPAVAENEKASQAEILEETIRYIDDLHRKLLRRVQTDGLPARLQQQQRRQMRGAGPEQGAATASASPPQPQMTPCELRDLIDASLRQQMEQSMRQKRAEDAARIRQLMQQRRRRQ